MKKIKLTIASLLIAGFSYSQAQDTICQMVAGNSHFVFDYDMGTILTRDVTSKMQDVIINIDTNQVLVLDLYDNCECILNKDFIKKRNVRFFNRNGKQVVLLSVKSGNKSYTIDGKITEKVIITKPNN